MKDVYDFIKRVKEVADREHKLRFIGLSEAAQIALESYLVENFNLVPLKTDSNSFELILDKCHSLRLYHGHNLVLISHGKTIRDIDSIFSTIRYAVFLESLKASDYQFPDETILATKRALGDGFVLFRLDDISYASDGIEFFRVYSMKDFAVEDFPITLKNAVFISQSSFILKEN